MSWLDIVATFVLNPMRFPVGLLRLWLIEEKRQKSFKQILHETDPAEICLHGTHSFIQIIAAIGVLLMLGMILVTIISIFRNGFTH